MTGYLRPSPAEHLPILAGIQPPELRRSGATISLGHCAMEPAHLLHSVLTHPSVAAARHLKSGHPFVSAAQQLISVSDIKNIRAVQWADQSLKRGVGGQPHKTLHFNSRHRYTHSRNDPPCVQLNHLRTSVGLFRSCLYKWGMASSAACECGAEEQTVDDVVRLCTIHRPPDGLHGLTVLDDETTELLIAS